MAYFKVLSRNSLEDWGELRKNLSQEHVESACNLADTRTEYFPNTILDSHSNASMMCTACVVGLILSDNTCRVRQSWTIIHRLRLDKKMSVTFDPALACKSTFINASSANSWCCMVSVCVALPCASYFFEQYTSSSQTRMPVTGVKVGDLPSRRRVDLRFWGRVLKVAPPPPTRGATSATTLPAVIHCLEPLSRADTHQHASSTPPVCWHFNRFVFFKFYFAFYICPHNENFRVWSRRIKRYESH